MTDIGKLRDLAEGFLDEMLEAERARDFDAWSHRWHANDLKGLNAQVFLNDLDQMEEELGAYRSRDYFGDVPGASGKKDAENTPKKWRFVWRLNFEKKATLSVVGILQVDGVWRPYMNSCSISS